MTAIAAHAAPPAATTQSAASAGRDETTASSSASDSGGFAALFNQLVTANNNPDGEVVSDEGPLENTEQSEKDILLEKLSTVLDEDSQATESEDSLNALAKSLLQDVTNNDNAQPTNTSPANAWAAFVAQQQGMLAHSVASQTPALLRELLPNQKNDKAVAATADNAVLSKDDPVLPANFAALAIKTATEAQVTPTSDTSIPNFEKTPPADNGSTLSASNTAKIATEEQPRTEDFTSLLTEEVKTNLSNTTNGLSTLTNGLQSLTTLQTPTPLAAKAEVAPAQLHIPVPVTQQQRWQDAFNQKVVWITGNQVQSAELQLNPIGLGPVEVRLDLQQDQANLVFLSSHQNVRDVIQAALPKLQEMLNNQGINMGSVHVGAETSGQSFAQSEHGQGQNSSSQQQAFQRQHSNSEHEGHSDSQPDGTTSSRRVSYLQDSGNTVDLFA